MIRELALVKICVGSLSRNLMSSLRPSQFVQFSRTLSDSAVRMINFACPQAFRVEAMSKSIHDTSVPLHFDTISNTNTDC